MGLFDKILGSTGAPRFPAGRLDEIREIYDAGRWRRALDELQAYPVEALLADAKALGLWLYFRANQKTPRPIGPDLQLLVRMTDADPDHVAAALRQVTPVEHEQMIPDLQAHAGRVSSPEIRERWREMLPRSIWSADDLDAALRKETITVMYDETLQVARARFPGDGRFQSPPPRPIDARERARLQQEEERRKKEVLEQELSRAGSLVRTSVDLERAIHEDPDDDARRLVYSDWLQAQGDPRGELGALQAAGEKAEASAFLRKNAPFFFGEIDFGEVDADRPELALVWRVGHVDTMRVAAHLYRGADHPIRVFASLPAFLFLRTLTVGLAFEEENHYASVVEALCAQPFPLLQKLFLGDFEYPDQSEMSWTDLCELAPLWAAYPQLRLLKLRGGAGSLGVIEAPELRSFCWETGGLDRKSLDAIVNARWPKLESLEIWFGDAGYGAEGGVGDLARLLAGEGLPALRHLALRNCAFADELVAALAGSAILRRVTSLDLSKSCLTDEGARAIARHRPAFAHLAKLDLTDNAMTGEGVELVRDACPDVWSDFQDAERVRDDRRYVPVGE